MQSAGEKVKVNSMNNAEATLSPFVLTKALKDVARIEIDPASSDFWQLAAIQVDSLMADAEKSAQLLERLEHYEQDIEFQSLKPMEASQYFSNFSPMRVKEVCVAPEDDLFEDAPTQGAMSRTYDLLRQKSGMKEYVYTTGGADQVHLSMGEALPFLAQIDTDKLHTFFSSALEELPRKRMDVFGRLLRLLRNDDILESYTCQVSQNSGIVELKHGESRSRLLYLTAGDKLVIHVAFDDFAFEEKLTVPPNASVEDAAVFSRGLLQAFHGHIEYAKVALTSLQHVIDRGPLEVIVAQENRVSDS